jgi:alginate O-acetyltransferase complex protein AlgI
VFVVTWALHSYQYFWLGGSFGMSWPNTMFWLTLGLLLVVNVWFEIRKGRRRRATSGHLRKGLSIVCTFTIVMTLWSLWSSPSLSAWLKMIVRAIGVD